MAFCAVLLLLLVFFAMTDGNISNPWAFTLGAAASLSSLWIWCAANGNSTSFQELPANAAIGSLSLDATLQGTEDLDGLKH